MSFELQLAHECPHFMNEEAVSLTNRQYLIPTAPIYSQESVFVMADDIFIPRAGLSNPASLQSSKKGPYKIEQCSDKTLANNTANVINITTNEGSESLVLPIGNQISIEKILKVFNLNSSLVLASVVSDSLLLTEVHESGAKSVIKVAGQGADSLGFLQKGSKGTEVFPGWFVENKRVAFAKPLHGNPNLKVSYSTRPQSCPRCQGTYIENDYRFDAQGDARLIQNEDLLYQACLKAVLTVIGSNPFHPAYGSAVTTRIGSKALQASANLIKSDIQTALQKVLNLQREQAKYQSVGAKETLYSISSVQVSQDRLDPTVFRSAVTVRS